MASFLLDNMDEILAEWETFASTLTPAASTMDSAALRDHAKQMLETIAKDVITAQSDRQQEAKSKGHAPVLPGKATAAASHGTLRHHVGFDLAQLVAEFRALRASVLRLWIEKKHYDNPDSVYEMTRFNEAIDQALAESVATYSDELAKSRDMFLGILGHDLRSPLSGLSGALQVMATSQDGGVKGRALAAGKRSVAAMDAMIRDLLLYTRTRLGKGIPITNSAANLESVCKAAIAEIGLVHPQTAFHFKASGALDGNFDSERVHQVISNLLNNAVQHGARGGPVTLVAIGSNAEELEMQVNNAGVIAPINLQAIFEPLVQVPVEGTEAPSTNLGLGLFIAREIIVAHGGTIEVTSTLAEGTTFTVVLPRGVAAGPG